MPKPKPSLAGIAIFVLIVLGAASVGGGFVLVYRDWPTPSADWADAGTRGDFWGGHLGAAASLAGTFFFIATLLLQNQELQAQRRELRETREIAEGQEKALRRQNEIADKTAVVSRILTLAEVRRNEIEASAKRLRINPNGKPGTKSTKDLWFYARAGARAKAVTALIEELLARPALDPTEREQLRTYAELDTFHLPRRPSELTVAFEPGSEAEKLQVQKRIDDICNQYG